jgi:hypothetical protein
MEKTMKLKRKLSAILATVLVAALVLALPASSYGAEGLIGDGSDKTTQTITYSWLSDAEQPEIPESVKMDSNGAWNLVSTSEPRINESYEHPYQDYEQTVNAVVKAGDDYKSLFEQTIAIDEGYLKGEIKLDGFEVKPGYNSNTAQVERTHVFKNVSDQEIDEIPETYEFKVKSDRAVNATAMVALALSESDYKATKYDEAGKAIEYTVTADYRGQESYLSHTYDTVYATYKGRVLDSREQWLIDATYEYVAAAPVVTLLPDNQVPLSAASNSVALAVAGAIIILAAWGLLWLLLLRKNASLMMTKAPAFYSKTGSGETIKRRYLKVVAGEAHFVVPDDVNLFDQEHNYSIALSTGLASKYGVVNVIWRNRMVAQAELSSAIDLHVSQAVYATAILLAEDLVATGAIRV